MGIRSSLVKAFARTELPAELKNGYPVTDRKGLPTIPVRFWSSDVWTGRTIADAGLTREVAYAGSALAFLCIQYRANKLCEPPLMVVEETDDGDEWIEDHELNDLLAHPNPDFSMQRLLALTSIYRDVTGAALWLKIRNNGKQTRRLWPFSRDEYVIESTDDRLFGKFRITTRGGEEEANPEDVVHFPGIDPWDPLGAVSPLDVVLRILGVNEELRTASKSALANAIQPSGAISVPETLNDAEFEAMMGQLLQQHTGANRGRPLLLTGGATWQQVQMTIAEMMPTDLIAWIEATVCAVFQLHPALLGVKSGLENSPWSHLATAKKMLYDEMAMPRWAADAEILTDQLLRDVDFDPSHLIRFDTSNIGALQDDLLEKITIAEKGLGFLTVDERRGLIDLEPVGGAVGKTIFVPAQWMPADMVVEPPEPKIPANLLPFTAPAGQQPPPPGGKKPPQGEQPPNPANADAVPAAAPTKE